jgi:hypothetical protein
MRDLLCEHIDGPVGYIARHDPGSRRYQTAQAAVTRGFLRFDNPAHPKQTILTTYGRERLCEELGKVADALVIAGIKEIDGLVVRRAIKARLFPQHGSPDPSSAHQNATARF